MCKIQYVCLAVVLSLSLPLAAQPASQGQTAVTIYNDNFGVVRQDRTLTFEEGINTLRFTDVAARIDPTTVHFTCLSDPNAVTIQEQNYEYDLVNTESLLKRYLDQPVTLQIKGSGGGEGTRVSGVLSASVNGDLILQDPSSGQMQIIPRTSVEQILLVKKPHELVTRPTLIWLARARAAGALPCRVSYTTEGIQWQADYLAVLDQNDTQLSLSAWVTIDNQSGASYPDAAVKLIAGDVRRITPPAPRYMQMDMVKAAAPRGGFEEKAFMEYHMYTLGRRTDIRDKQIKQIELFEPVSNVPVTKQFVYEVSGDTRMPASKKVQVKMEFQNTPENNLGMPLPKGKVRVFKRDPADETLEFVGEDQIDHTAKGAKPSLYIGNAFDITVEDTLLDSQQGRGFQTYTRQVKLRNSRQADAVVFVEEKIPQGRNWSVEKASLPYEKKDAFTVRFSVPVPAGEQTVLEYRLSQTW